MEQILFDSMMQASPLMSASPFEADRVKRTPPVNTKFDYREAMHRAKDRSKVDVEYTSMAVVPCHRCFLALSLTHNSAGSVQECPRMRTKLRMCTTR